MPDWEVNDGLTARDWGIPRFWIQAGLHDPDIVMARFDYAYDPNAARVLERIGVDSSTLELIDANEAAIEPPGWSSTATRHPARDTGSERSVLRVGGQRRQAGRLGRSAARR